MAIIEHEIGGPDPRVERFEALYAECAPRLIALYRRQLGCQGDAESLAQEAFLRAWASIDTYNVDRPFWPWLSTIARRLWIDHLRRERGDRVRLRLAARTVPVPSATPEEAAVLQEEITHLRRAFAELRPRDQRLLRLREAEGWSTAELAQQEEMSAEAVRTALKRARISLRTAYERAASGALAVLGAGYRRIRGAQVRFASTITRSPDEATAVALARLGQFGMATMAAVMLASSLPHGGGSNRPTQVDAATGNAAATAGTSGTDRGAVRTTGATTSPPTTVERATPDAPMPTAPIALPIAFDDSSQPEDIRFYDFAASPRYDDDGTVLAAGHVTLGCKKTSCPALFRSTDRGATWTRLPAEGFEGGRLLLPPAYPTDNRIFAANDAALFVSRNGGGSFEPAAAVGGPAAMSPRFSDGDPRILLGAQPGWSYNASTGVLSPARFTVSSTSDSMTVAFHPDGERVVLGTVRADVDGNPVSTVFSCTGSVCDDGLSLGGGIEPPQVAVDARGDVWAWQGRHLFRAPAGGTARMVPLPAPEIVRHVTFGKGGEVYVALADQLGARPSGGLVVSRDGGGSWSIVPDERVGRGIDRVLVLPRGRMLVARPVAAGGGFLCTTDDGTSWAPRCVA